uniref:E3 ubiquitin-protein ligase MARCH3 n=2 Tax=Cacopsylla melanoneura TaxID=428564 RepID=A0A8D8X9X4_9HEMI
MSSFQLFAVNTTTNKSTNFLQHKDELTARPSTILEDEIDGNQGGEIAGPSTSTQETVRNESHHGSASGQIGILNKSIYIEQRLPSNIDSKYTNNKEQIKAQISKSDSQNEPTKTASDDKHSKEEPEEESEEIKEDSAISLHSIERSLFERLLKQLEKKPEVENEDNNQDICRICYGTDEQNLLSVCHCKGSIGHVHVACLERWLQECGMDNCDLCKYKFITVRKPTQSKWSSLISWFKSADNHDDVAEMVTDFAATFLFCPFIVLLTISGYQTITTNSISVFVPDANNKLKFSLTGTISAVALLSIISLVNSIGLSWLCYIGHKHYSRWYTWYRRSTIVKIILPEHGEMKDSIENHN